MSVHYGAFRNLQVNLQLNRGDTLQFKSVTGHYVPVRVQTFVQATAPVAVAGSDLVPTVVLNYGDIWVDTSTVSREQYTWNGAAWVKNAIPSAGVNIKNSDGVTPLSQLSNLNPNLGNITTGNIVSTVLDGGFNYSLWLNETATNTDVIAAGLSSLGKGSVPFRVSRAGVLYASGATISGAITATSGDIGGWTINSGYLAKDTGVDAASAGLAPLDFPFYAGATYANRASAPYRVTPAGALAASSGTIGGWALDTNMLRSTGVGTARIELDQSAARISVKDATNASKTVMGYLNGLAKHDGTGNWGAGDYGFWAAAGDNLKIDGDARYKSGDWIVENDGSFLVQNGSGTTIVRLGTVSAVKGLYLYDSTPTLLAKFATDGIYLGTAGGAANSLAYTVGGGLNIRGAITADTGYIGGTGGWTITAGKWYGGSGAAFSGSIQGTGATKSFFAGATDNAGTGATYYVTAAGALYASSASISGTVTSSSFSTAASGKRVDISVTTPNEITFYGDRGDTIVESLATIGIATSGLDTVIGLFGSAASTRIALKALSDSNVAMHGYSAQSCGVVGESSGIFAGVRGTGANIGVEGYSASGLSGKFTCNVNWGGIYLVPYNGAPGGTAEGQLSADDLNHVLKYRDNSAWRTVLTNVSTTSALTTVGALNSGSITSGFGSIDIGADSLTAGAGSFTTGAFSGVATFSGGSGNAPVVLKETSAGGSLYLQYNTSAGARRAYLGFGSGSANPRFDLVVDDAAGSFSMNRPLSVTGQINSSGRITVTAPAATDSEGLFLIGSTTASHRADIYNTGGFLRLGVDNSAGTALITGGSAYGSVLGTNNATALHLITDGTSRFKIDSAGAVTVPGLATFSKALAQPVQRYTGGTGTVTASAGVRTLLLDTNLGAGALTVAFPTATADGQEFTIASWYTLTNVTLSAAGTNLANSGITTISQGRAATWTWLAATSSWFYAGGQ